MKVLLLMDDGTTQEINGVVKCIMEEEAHTSQDGSVQNAMPKYESFEVNPSRGIDMLFFYTPRKDPMQEELRQFIYEALTEGGKHIDKYLKPFTIIIPNEKEKGGKSLRDYMQLAEKEYGGQIADWIYVSFFWAYRIQYFKGGPEKGWEEICNKENTIKYARVFVSKNGTAKLFGSANTKKEGFIQHYNMPMDHVIYDAVPVIVKKTKHL